MKQWAIILFMLIASTAYGSLGIGYTTNLPDEWAGIGVFWLRDGIGLFFSNSTDLKDRKTMDISNNLINTWGDTRQRTEKAYSGAVFGITYPLAKDVYIYAGYGSRATKRYYEYYDPLGILGNNGHYWIKGFITTEPRYAGGIIALQNRLMWVIGISGKPIRVSGGIARVF